MRTLLFAFAVLAASVAHSQDDEGEVIVIAELNRTEVRQFIEEAEDQLYAIFNANVDDEDFEVTCGRITPTGSNISVRACEPEFMNRARADNMASFQFNRGTELTDSELRTRLAPEFAQMQEKMETMAREVPEFAQIASILTQLRARLDQLTN